MRRSYYYERSNAVKHVEQVELILFRNGTFARFRELRDVVCKWHGRMYYRVTEASLQRIIRLLNSDYCDLSIRKRGNFISLYGNRAYPLIRFLEGDQDDYQIELQDEDGHRQ